MKDNRWGIQMPFHFPGEDFGRRTEELEAVPDLAPDEKGIITAPVLPLREMVIFPQMVSPLYLGREFTLKAVEEAHAKGTTMIAMPQMDPNVEFPDIGDFLDYGVEMAVGRLIDMPNEASTALVQGRRRVKIVKFVQREPYYIVQAKIVEELKSEELETDALMRSVLQLFEKYIDLNRNIPDEAFSLVLNIDEPGWLADVIIATVSTPLEIQHKIVSTLDPLERLHITMTVLMREVDVLSLQEEIYEKVQSEFEKGHRENYLREQMRTIQTELGEGDLNAQEIGEITERIKKANLPEVVEKRTQKELKRLNHMPPMSPEVGVIRTYIEWILDLPWHEMSEANMDVANASEVLEQYHYGLPKAKDRILEYIAVRSLKPKKNRQPILCFVGPPGTGKTSLGRSIAQALNREFVRLSLGGVRDEAEIRGHRRTYIGALPGRILQTMKRAGQLNPLFMLDEIDKLSSDVRGDPASALLEVLDPEQNNAFSDHYLELDYDLSQVMFITTANSRETIPWALLDRMEVIEFPGYIEEEKVEIAKQFLIQRQMDETGLDANEITFTDQALRTLIREYTYEAGVRNLEREIGRICRKIARLKVEGKKHPSRVLPSVLEKLLGPARINNLEAEGEDEVGTVTALAWTEGGGDIMPVEILLMAGKGNVQITGSIGEIMQESAQASVSYFKSKADQFELDPAIFEETDIHIHVPEGAIPKDGPSAGITIACAVISAFTNRKVDRQVGMTGEITLRGKVLPVGGVREKVLAAHRAGLKKVILPYKNLRDLVDVPKKAKTDLEIIGVKTMQEVLEVALLPAETAKKAARSKNTAKSKEK